MAIRRGGDMVVVPTVYCIVFILQYCASCGKPTLLLSVTKLLKINNVSTPTGPLKALGAQIWVVRTIIVWRPLCKQGTLPNSLTSESWRGHNGLFFRFRVGFCLFPVDFNISLLRQKMLLNRSNTRIIHNSRWIWSLHIPPTPSGRAGCRLD